MGDIWTVAGWKWGNPERPTQKWNINAKTGKKETKPEAKKNESICIDDMAFCTSEGIPTLKGLSGNGSGIVLIFKSQQNYALNIQHNTTITIFAGKKDKTSKPIFRFQKYWKK